MSDDRQAIERLGGVFFDSYFVLNRDRRIDSFNNGFIQMLGLRHSERREMVGRPCFELLELEICREQCIALECLAKNAPVRREEIRGRTTKGQELVLELSAVPLRDDSGIVTGVFVTHRDVTDERRLKTRYLEERQAGRNERDALLKIIHERDEELEELKARMRFNRG